MAEDDEDQSEGRVGDIAQCCLVQLGGGMEDGGREDMARDALDVTVLIMEHSCSGRRSTPPSLRSLHWWC